MSDLPELRFEPARLGEVPPAVTQALARLVHHLDLSLEDALIVGRELADAWLAGQDAMLVDMSAHLIERGIANVFIDRDGLQGSREGA